MSKIKKKAKKPAAKAAPAEKPPVKTITTIEDDEPPPPLPEDEPPPPESIKRLKPFIMSALSQPVQRNVNDVLFPFIYDFLRGDDIDVKALEKALFGVKIGNTPLFEIVDKLEEIGKIISQIK